MASNKRDCRGIKIEDSENKFDCNPTTITATIKHERISNDTKVLIRQLKFDKYALLALMELELYQSGYSTHSEFCCIIRKSPETMKAVNAAILKCPVLCSQGYISSLECSIITKTFQLIQKTIDFVEPTFQFLSLPAKVRRMIYILVFQYNRLIFVGGAIESFAMNDKLIYKSVHFPLLRTCKHIYAEASLVFYGNTTIHFTSPSRLSDYFSLCPQRSVKRLQHPIKHVSFLWLGFMAKYAFSDLEVRTQLESLTVHLMPGNAYDQITDSIDEFRQLVHIQIANRLKYSGLEQLLLLRGLKSVDVAGSNIYTEQERLGLQGLLRSKLLLPRTAAPR